MSALTFTSPQVLELAEALEARAARAQLVLGRGHRCATADAIRDCAAQVRRFAQVPAPGPAVLAHLQASHLRRIDVESTALALEACARELPPRHAQVARDAVLVLRRFLDLEATAR